MSWIQCHAENGACGTIFLSIYFQILQLCVSYYRKQEEVKHTPITFDKQLMWTCSMTRLPWEFTRPDQKQKKLKKTAIYFSNIVL